MAALQIGHGGTVTIGSGPPRWVFPDWGPYVVLEPSDEAWARPLRIGYEKPIVLQMRSWEAVTEGPDLGGGRRGLRLGEPECEAGDP